MKHPTAWIDFEKGQICEDALVRNFFQDGRTFNSEGMKRMMVSRTLNSVILYGELHIHIFITNLSTSEGRGVPNRVCHILRQTQRPGGIPLLHKMFQTAALYICGTHPENRPFCSVVALNFQEAASLKPSLAVCSIPKLAVCLSQIESCHYLKGAQELLQELAESNIEQHAMSNYPVWYQHIDAKLQLDRCGREALPVAGLLDTNKPG